MAVAAAHAKGARRSDGSGAAQLFLRGCAIEVVGEAGEGIDESDRRPRRRFDGAANAAEQAIEETGGSGLRQRGGNKPGATHSHSNAIKLFLAQQSHRDARLTLSATH